MPATCPVTPPPTVVFACHSSSPRSYSPSPGMASTVVVTNKAATPSRSSQPASLLLASKAQRPSQRAIPNPDRKPIWNPGKAPSGPVSILLSYKDATVYIYRNGTQIGQSPVGISGPANLPEGVFYAT